MDLPPDWLELPPKAVTKRPKPIQPARAVTVPKPASKRVINLAEPPAPAKTNRSRGRITTPVPAKKGTKTLDLAGKQDAFNRRSKSIIDMRAAKPPKGR